LSSGRLTIPGPAVLAGLVLPVTQDEHGGVIDGECLEPGISGGLKRGGAHGVAGMLMVAGTCALGAAGWSW
jgi:hypothetical protein